MTHEQYKLVMATLIRDVVEGGRLDDRVRATDALSDFMRSVAVYSQSLGVDLLYEPEMESNPNGPPPLA